MAKAAGGAVGRTSSISSEVTQYCPLLETQWSAMYQDVPTHIYGPEPSQKYIYIFQFPHTIFVLPNKKNAFNLVFSLSVFFFNTFFFGSNDQYLLCFVCSSFFLLILQIEHIETTRIPLSNMSMRQKKNAYVTLCL